MSVVFLIFIQLCRGGFCRGQSGPEYFFYKRVEKLYLIWELF